MNGFLWHLVIAYVCVLCLCATYIYCNVSFLCFSTLYGRFLPLLLTAFIICTLHKHVLFLDTFILCYENRHAGANKVETLQKIQSHSVRFGIG